jgi:hypothetical protein
VLRLIRRCVAGLREEPAMESAVVGKAHTVAIERGKGGTRHHYQPVRKTSENYVICMLVSTLGVAKVLSPTFSERVGREHGTRLHRSQLQNASFAIPTELVGCVRSGAGRAFGASCMLRFSNDALSVRLAAPDADCGAEGADGNPGFARGSPEWLFCGKRGREPWQARTTKGGTAVLGEGAAGFHSAFSSQDPQPHALHVGPFGVAYRVGVVGRLA